MSFSVRDWAIKDARERGIHVSHQAEKACAALELRGKRFAIDFGYENALPMLMDMNSEAVN